MHASFVSYLKEEAEALGVGAAADLGADHAQAHPERGAEGPVDRDAGGHVASRVHKGRGGGWQGQSHSGSHRDQTDHSPTLDPK